MGGREAGAPGLSPAPGRRQEEPGPAPRLRARRGGREGSAPDVAHAIPGIASSRSPGALGWAFAAAEQRGFWPLSSRQADVPRTGTAHRELRSR